MYIERKRRFLCLMICIALDEKPYLVRKRSKSDRFRSFP